MFGIVNAKAELLKWSSDNLAKLMAKPMVKLATKVGLLMIRFGVVHELAHKPHSSMDGESDKAGGDEAIDLGGT